MLKKRKKIAFLLNKISNYADAQPANRLRAYDIISRLNKLKFKAELYDSGKVYDIVIINRIFDDTIPDLIKSLQAKGTIVGIDEVVNYVNTSGNETSYVNNYVSNKQRERMQKVLENADFVIVPSHNLQTEYLNYHSNVYCIEDMVYDYIFKGNKKHEKSENINLVYCGASQKAIELLRIKNVLEKLYVKFGVKLLFITETDPGINFIPYQFIKYDQNKLVSQLLNGDIKIAPRDLSNAYNLGHSSLKIAYPMAVGLPVVGSKVPSYINRGTLLASTEEDWERILTDLIKNPSRREYYGSRAKEEIRKNLGEKKILADYELMFEHLFKQR